MSARVEITMSKQFKDAMDPAVFEKRMVRFNQALGNMLLGRQDKLITGDTGVARMNPAPLQRSFGKYPKGNNRVRKFKKYASEEYEEEKKLVGNRFLIYSGDLFQDAVTDAVITANARGVVVRARRGGSKDYQLAHQLGTKTMPKRPPYIIDETDKRAMALPLTTVLKALFRGSLATATLR